ncbi:EFR1 family ferrodoxin [uncultured Megasphaera sp.]|uniref:EFR1 family ferrodoxin n=1 Tax=Megasphaera massiliensis TaxID=1232428 RepID=UPI00266C263E|nr:EFR1 family ferrodoxin [uncultured Megasphaera sp.]
MIGYFSGTGNSLYAAKKLAELTGDRALPLADIMGQPEHLPHRRFGIVFPVYFGDVPEPVRDFIAKAPLDKGTYFFGIATCGGTGGRTLRTLSRLLKKRGCDLAYGLVLPMIANSTVASRRHIHYDMNRLDRADDVLHDCADDIRRQVRDASEVTGSLAADVMNFGPLRSLGNYWLTPSVDPKKCVSCGICTKICPVDNIQSTSSGAVIGSRCSRCLACLHWCPHQAVTVHGKTVLPQDQYHHPDVTIRDMMVR